MGRTYKELFAFSNIVKLQVDAADPNCMEFVVNLPQNKQGEETDLMCLVCFFFFFSDFLFCVLKKRSI